MAYSSGMLDKLVTILNRKEAETSKFGLDGDGVKWEDTACVHANISWAKGMRSLNAGALDAYAVKQVRMRWTSDVTMRSRIKYEDQTYQILPETFNADRRANTIQFLMQGIINEQGL